MLSESTSQGFWRSHLLLEADERMQADNGQKVAEDFALFFKMWTTPVLLLTILVSSYNCLDEVTVTSSFRRLGSFGTGLSYAHIHGTINFLNLRQAHREVLRVMDDRLRTSASKEESTLLEALRPQLDIATKTIDDLEVLFFGSPSHRQKRQLFLGMAVALGLVSAGTSIYTTTQVSRLHHEISSLTSDVQHIAHVLEHEAQVVNRLTANMNTVSKTCQLVLGRLLQEENRLNMLTGVLGLTAIVSNFNAELAAWARGLEALQTGKLHPALIDHKKLKNALHNIEEKAKASGRRLLHDQANAIFNAPVSYLATDKGMIILIAHIPLIDHELMDLYEYRPTPVKVRNLYLEITTSNKILAFDKRGQQGKELSHHELLQCHSEDLHSGKIFICPEANLFQNGIRKSCLGSLFFNDQKLIEEKCDHLLSKRTHEKIQQLDQNELLAFMPEETTVTERCSNGTNFLQIKEGLTKLRTKPGCSVTTRDFTFRSLIDINHEENFIQHEIRTTKLSFLESKTDSEIHQAIEAISNLKMPETIRTDEVQTWLSNQNQDRWMTGMHWTTTSVTIVLSMATAAVILILFLRHKRTQSSK